MNCPELRGFAGLGGRVAEGVGQRLRVRVKMVGAQVGFVEMWTGWRATTAPRSASPRVVRGSARWALTTATRPETRTTTLDSVTEDVAWEGRGTWSEAPADFWASFRPEDPPVWRAGWSRSSTRTTAGAEAGATNETTSADFASGSTRTRTDCGRSPAGRVERGRDLTRGVGGRQARTGGLIATGEGDERITLFVGGGLFLATL